jgi:toxin secretion/phage lysis holin
MRLLFNFQAWLTSAKTLFSLGAALVLTFVEKYLFNDWNFLAYLGVLIVVDTVFGVQHHWVQHTISSRAFSRLFTKCIIYMGLLVLTHVLTTFQVHGKPQVLFSWFDTFMYSCMMAREGLSILEHIAGIEPRLVPRALLKRLALISNEGIEAAMVAMPAAQYSDAALNLTPAAEVVTLDPSPLTPVAE